MCNLRNLRNMNNDYLCQVPNADNNCEEESSVMDVVGAKEVQVGTSPPAGLYVELNEVETGGAGEI